MPFSAPDRTGACCVTAAVEGSGTVGTAGSGGVAGAALTRLGLTAAAAKIEKAMTGLRIVDAGGR